VLANSTHAPVCTKCGSQDVLPLVFGYPDGEIEAKARRGEVALGGCICWGDMRDPRWGCRECGERWGAVVPHSRLSVLTYQPQRRRWMSATKMRKLWDEVLERPPS
jgi:hypothetical protein